MPGRTAWWWSSLLLWLCVLPLHAQQTFSYQQAPLARVVADIEARTAYRFLYRDALLEGRTVTLEAAVPSLPEALGTALRPQGLGVQTDNVHAQILLYALRDSATVLSGYVLDATTGARLPYATLTWRDGGRLRGVVASDGGAFTLIAPPGVGTLDLTASFVGYAPRTVRVAAHTGGRIAFRLTPRDVWIGETVVLGSLLQADLDTTLATALAARTAPGQAEPSTLRTLQVLPSVGIAPAFASGPNVRGARADGFEVLLDGVSIYAPTHFFGLFDAFNSDALQTVAFYFDVAPAAYFAPPGGTLAYNTRTGSQRASQATVGLTNTSVRGTVEAPLAGGRGSFLVSGRHSALGAFGWMGNDALIQMGLDVARPTGDLPRTALDIESLTVRPGRAEASFYDAHAKLLYEMPGGSRWMLSGYAGADATEQDATRITQVSSTNTQPRLVPEPVTTRNAWRSQTVSLQQQTTWRRATLSTIAALSSYGARFEKDDFAFERDPTRPASLLRGRVDTLGYRNDFREWRLTQQAALPLSRPLALTLGYSLHRYDARYEEQSGRRPRFYEHAFSTQVDAFGELTHTTPVLAARLGLRAHAFAQGDFYRLSPRLRVEVTPSPRLSAAVGYSRNHQFLHRLYLENFPSAAVWVLSRGDAPPVESESVSGTVRLRLSPSLTFQVDAYTRRTDNLRQHETNSVARRLGSEATFTRPWLVDLQARTRGLETLLVAASGPVSWTNAYTLSRTHLKHPELNSGQSFRADWDRTHQYRSSLSLAMTPALSFQALWLYGTGTPNRLAYELDGEPETLAAYHRLDAAVRFAHALPTGAQFEVSFALYNLYDRENPWYRETVSVVEENPRPPRRTFGYYNVDVYDLGVTPSFEMRVRW